MLGTPIFWLMFAMMTMMSTTGLMVTSQMGAFTRDFGLANALVFGLPVLPLALSIDRITNGATRPLFGWISDQFGRENTMLIAFAPRRRRHDVVAADAREPGAVRADVRTGILRLG